MKQLFCNALAITVLISCNRVRQGSKHVQDRSNEFRQQVIQLLKSKGVAVKHPDGHDECFRIPVDVWESHKAMLEASQEIERGWLSAAFDDKVGKTCRVCIHGNEE